MINLLIHLWSGCFISEDLRNLTAVKWTDDSGMKHSDRVFLHTRAGRSDVQSRRCHRWALYFWSWKELPFFIFCPSLTYKLLFVFIELHFSTFFSHTVMLLLPCFWLRATASINVILFSSLRSLAVYAEEFLLVNNVFSGACYGQGWM